MAIQLNIKQKRILKHARARSRFSGTTERPRLSVFRSNSHMYVQVIDDVKGVTIVGISSKSIPEKMKATEKAMRLGELIGKAAQEKGVKKIVFDRGGFLFHGRIKALADGARKAGLEF